MPGPLHHFGLVVPDMAAARHAWQAQGYAVSEPVPMPERGFILAYVELGNARIELTQPTVADNASGRFLAANPQGGINHIAIEAADIDAARDGLVAQGAAVMGGPAARIDRDGVRLHVLDAMALLGTLVEIRERPP